MASLRERINAHLPIVLQFISTASLVVLALSALCGSQSLKRLSESHEIQGHDSTNKSHMIHRHEK